MKIVAGTGIEAAAGEGLEGDDTGAEDGAAESVTTECCVGDSTFKP